MIEKMSQVLARQFDCLTCHKPIRISKIDNVPAGQKKKWEKYELDGVTEHICHKQQHHLEQQKQQLDVSKEIADIKAQLLILVSRLDYVEKELR
jgi:hypothetical protein